MGEIKEIILELSVRGKQHWEEEGFHKSVVLSGTVFSGALLGYLLTLCLQMALPTIFIIPIIFIPFAVFGFCMLKDFSQKFSFAICVSGNHPEQAFLAEGSNIYYMGHTENGKAYKMPVFKNGYELEKFSDTEYVMVGKPSDQIAHYAKVILMSQDAIVWKAKQVQISVATAKQDFQLDTQKGDCT